MIKEKRQVRRNESIWTESNSSPTGKFSHLHQEKDIMTSLFIFILSIENWMHFPKKALSSLQSILTWTVFSYQIQEMTEQGIPQRHSRPGRSLQQPQPRSQTKTTP